jgi:stage IV sporulation protein B
VRYRRISLILLCLIILVVLSPYQRSLWKLPQELRIKEGIGYRLDFNPPIGVSIGLDKSKTHAPPVLLKVVGRRDGIKVTGGDLGETSLEIKFLGLIPLRYVNVAIVPEIKVIPGGHSIGVVLRSKGVTVCKIVPVIDTNGRVNTPAEDAGLNEGDVILKCDGDPVTGDEQLSLLVQKAGRSGGEVCLEGRRSDGSLFELRVKPVRCKNTGRFLIGAWVKDKIAGVGTLTFFDPETGCFAALGHTVIDLETSRPVDIREGEIVKASVSAIDQGQRGRPGEKIGVFVEEDDVLGMIERNTRFGIIGTLRTPAGNPFFDEAISVALPEEVEAGPAEIYTVVEGQNIRAYKCEVVRVKKQNSPDGKGLIIKITDPKLLEKTGGIVQGMSGSPIIQEGKLIGAVTHVFVNDPTKGYGVFAEWMLKEVYTDPKTKIVGHGDAEVFRKKAG